MREVRPFPRDGHVPQKPGSWVRRHGLVTFVCPLCGTGQELTQTVLVDGTLTQAVTCSTRTCTFRENVRLDGWDPSLGAGSPGWDDGRTRYVSGEPWR